MSDTDLDTDFRGHGGAAPDVALSGDSFVAPPATDSLRVDVRQTPGGVVGYEALPDHRLKLHAGAPVAGACQFHRFLYTRGDLDILPAGSTDIWHEESASTSAPPLSSACAVARPMPRVPPVMTAFLPA